MDENINRHNNEHNNERNNEFNNDRRTYITEQTKVSLSLRSEILLIIAIIGILLSIFKVYSTLASDIKDVDYNLRDHKKLDSLTFNNKLERIEYDVRTIKKHFGLE